ncbi:RNA methyltransferase [Orrella sp. JC864]|uniref:TrmH family RNA methyltransferase n=1 Tax=Orrella sp. JC864 TaxID=3120298 RepID=UPI001429B9ED
MKTVVSRENPVYKTLRAQAARAGRAGEPAVLEGPHLCQAWLQHGGLPAMAVFDAERLDEPVLAGLADAVRAAACVALPSRLLAGLETVPASQGVLFVVQPPAPVLPARLQENCVWLDRIQDPGNVGTLLRTCAAAGVRRVLLSEGCAAAWSPKVLRSGQGAHFALQLHEQVDLRAAVARLAVPLAATALAQAQDLYQAALPPACAWVFGHEGQGVDPALLQAATLRLRIPHDSAAVESLNVAAAAAVCLFEQRRRQLARGPAPAPRP